MLKQMMSNDKILSETGRCIDENIKNLQEQVQKSVAATKAQDSLNKILLQFEMDRCRKSFWNEEPNQNPWSMPKKIPLQHHISKPLEQLMQTNECLVEIQEEVNEIAKAIEKLSVHCKHWDQVYQQYHVNNYHYIDSHGILHEDVMQYVDSDGVAHTSPLQFVAPFGTVYNDLNYESDTMEADEKYKRAKTYDVVQYFFKIYGERSNGGNLKMFTNGFQKQILLSDFSGWMVRNYSKFYN